ncbi:MAG TPA: vitamin B12-dependent ribonucleotide reductase, partial [Terriglobia bacterium]|nr:vitamin B12-dependent ribonucleotide reductase [Terriglobia bacterium]
GSTISGLMDSFATAVSYALQYGVPLKFFVDKFSHVRFEPSGWTGNATVPYAKSIMDYIFRYLASKFLPVEEARALGVQVDEPPLTKLTILAPPAPAAEVVAPTTPGQPTKKGALVDIQDRDAPVCFECGSLMVRNGACYKCLNCGSTSGCS